MEGKMRTQVLCANAWSVCVHVNAYVYMWVCARVSVCLYLCMPVWWIKSWIKWLVSNSEDGPSFVLCFLFHPHSKRMFIAHLREPSIRGIRSPEDAPTHQVWSEPLLARESICPRPSCSIVCRYLSSTLKKIWGDTQWPSRFYSLGLIK